MAFFNWASNVRFSADRLHTPTSIEELRALVARSDRVRALGTGHSFSTIADSKGALISAAALPPRIEIDSRTSTATVSAGTRYGELATALHARGYALENLGSLPHISVAGACATGTHGSGDGNSGLAGAVRAFEFVTADGEIVRVDREGDLSIFSGTVVALGSLGIVTALTLDVVPAFEICQTVYDDMPGDELLAHFDEITSRAYSVSLFTRWQNKNIDQVWLKQKPDERPASEPSWMSATLATTARHPIPGMPAENCTQQQGVPGPWHERLPHFRLEFTPSNGQELQSEYLIPREHATEAIERLFGLQQLISPVLQISEIRTVAADDLWLSPAYGRDTVGVHFTWTKDQPAVLAVLPAIEDALSDFDARPHWGKLFTIAPETVRRLYPRVGDFETLLSRYDPNGKFRNAFVDAYFLEA